MKSTRELPSGLYNYLGVGTCRICGGKVRILQDTANPALIYLEEHVSSSGGTCSGSDKETSAPEGKKG